MVLWGSWLDSEVVIGTDPLIELSRLDAAQCWAPLSATPQPTPGFEGIGGGWVTVLGYDPGTSWLAFYDSLLRRRADGTWVFESLGIAGREDVAAAHLERARTALGASSRALGPGAGIGPLSPIGSDQPQGADRRAAADHLAGVERVIGRIRTGEVYQLNLCTRLQARLVEPPLELFVRTADTLRPSYGAFLPTGSDSALVSLSPERFLTVRDALVTTSPIKGTTKRTDDPDGSQLRASAKDAAENIMITDLMRNDLSRVCEPGSVIVTGLLEVRPHPGVWHLVSTVQGRLPEGASVSELLAATFPPGSVTGAPKSSAVAAIAAEEQHARSAYTGAAGLITIDGRADVSVLIRTFEITGEQVELGVGGGITVDSVPVREWQECLHKAEPLARAAGSRLSDGLRKHPPSIPDQLVRGGVFESILVQNGRPVRLADHLARLVRSVRELYGDTLPDDTGPRALRAAVSVADHPRSALRIRVRPRAGRLDVEVSVQPLGRRLRHCDLALASRSDISWRHKWSQRDQLQMAEQRTTPALPYFLDPGGHLAETSRGSLFVQGADGGWRTPPASDHLLPGVTRRALLDALSDRGMRCEIAPISAEEFAAALALVWTSSLSGVVAVGALDSRTLTAANPAETWSAWVGCP